MNARNGILATIVVTSLLFTDGAPFCGQRVCGQPPAKLNEPFQEKPAKRRTPRPIHTTGHVHAVAPGILYVIADGGDEWTFKIIEKTVIEVRGETDARALGTGTPVHFYAFLDRRRTARDELRELTIFSPGPDARPTIELQTDTENQSPDPAADFQRHYVAGRVRSFRKNHLTVSAGESRTVRARLAKEARVKIASDDYQMARPGDEIEIEGYYVYPGRANAHKVTITLNLEEDDQGIPIRDGLRGASPIKKRH